MKIACKECGRGFKLSDRRPPDDPDLCDGCLAGPLPAEPLSGLSPGRSLLASRWFPLSFWTVERYYSQMADKYHDELVEEAWLYLCRAAMRWDRNGKAAFNTYAVRGMQLGVLNYIKRDICHAEAMVPDSQRIPDRADPSDLIGDGERADDAVWRVDRLLTNLRTTPRPHGGRRARLHPADAVWLHHGVGLTLQEVADRYGVTREWVRQLCEDAISHMRSALITN